MPSLDWRTRTDADVRPVDPAAFFTAELPELAARRSGLAAPGAAELGVESLTFLTSAGPFTLDLVEGTVVVEPGDRGAAALRLDDDDLQALVNDLATPMTFLTGGTLDQPRGDLGDALDWWVVLRSLLDEHPAHTAGSVDFVDRDGAPLDLGRSFGPDDDDADIAHFLAEAGFVHLRGWFDPEDMGRISADMDAALPRYAPDDGRSWWATTADGRRHCVRMQHFDHHSPTTAVLLAGEGFGRLAGLTGDGHALRPEGANRIEALVKPLGVVEGISDVPWHKDCSLGMHSYNCCSLTVGVSVTGADATSGQLRVVAGSHRALVQPAFVRESWGLPILDLPTSTGDVTVHCSCTLHMAQPPVERERRVMYTSLVLPSLGSAEVLARGRQEIGRVREGAHRTVSQQPGHVA